MRKVVDALAASHAQDCLHLLGIEQWAQNLSPGRVRHSAERGSLTKGNGIAKLGSIARKLEPR
jgi:hypothetical protein